MASLYLIWNIKEQRVEGIFGSSADATTAIRRVSGKSGTRVGAQSGKASTAAVDLEILTCTKP